MTVKGVLAAVLLGLMGVMWWVQIVPSPPTGVPPATRRATPAGLEAPDVELRRLLERTVAVPLNGARRDPFGGERASGASGTASSGAVRRDAAGLRDGEDTVAAPSWPRLELIGVAKTRTADGDGHVAVLAGDRGVIHARAGDVVAEVYRIEGVSDDAVEVLLMPEDRVFTLTLR